MLTAWDLDRDRQTFLLYGTELGATGQIERLQQALLALSRTGLPLANPGAITGALTKQTMFALLTVLKDLDLGWALKAQLIALAYDAAQSVGNSIESYLSGPAEDAYASLVTAVETAAPTLTTAVTNLTQKRAGQTQTPTSSARSLLERFAKGGAYQATPSYAPPPHTAVPASSANSKAATALLIGVAVLGAGVAGWWLLKPG